MSSPKFTGSPAQLKAKYESGQNVSKIMDETGMDYEEVSTRLRRAGTKLVTGGPHDISKCKGRHSH